MGFGDSVAALLETYSNCLKLLKAFDGGGGADSASVSEGQLLRSSIKTDRAKVRRAYSSQRSVAGSRFEKGDRENPPSPVSPWDHEEGSQGVDSPRQVRPGRRSGVCSSVSRRPSPASLTSERTLARFSPTTLSCRCPMPRGSTPSTPSTSCRAACRRGRLGVRWRPRLPSRRTAGDGDGGPRLRGRAPRRTARLLGTEPRRPCRESSPVSRLVRPNPTRVATARPKARPRVLTKPGTATESGTARLSQRRRGRRLRTACRWPQCLRTALSWGRYRLES